MEVIKDIQDINRVAKIIFPKLREHSIIAFYGQMGAGKTTLIKELCKLAGVRENVSSPTFSLVNEYHTKEGTSIFHFDFYRINRIEEVYDLGYEEYFYGNNLCLIEWPEKLGDLLPTDTFSIKIEVNQTGERQLYF